MLENVLFFTTCKPFEGEAAILQRNAFLTWQNLGLKVLVLGDEAGARETASEFGFKHAGGVRCNETGSPYLGSLIEKAEGQADSTYIAYINADIMLLPETGTTIERAIGQGKTASPFLMTMRRKNIPLLSALDPTAQNWMGTLASLANKYGTWDAADAVDLFLFTPKMLGEIPELVIGHMSWDNWLLWKARQQGAHVIDLSLSASLLHPIHGYTVAGKSWQLVTQGVEAQRNRAIVASNRLDLCTATTHVMVEDAIKPVSEDIRGRVARHCREDPEKAGQCGMLYLATLLGTASLPAVVDFCRTLLWRRKLFFPMLASEDPETQDKIDLFIPILETIQSKDFDTAILQIQNLVAAAYLHSVRNAAHSGRPIHIWGCGKAGKRQLAFLTRHKVAATCFVDSNKSIWGQTLEGIPIAAPNLEHGKTAAQRPFFSIASMYSAEIAATLTDAGFQHSIDFSG